MKSLLQRWVTDQAMQRPDSKAVIGERTSLSYKDLEIQSNRLANILIELGCKRGDRVCFLMPKVPEAIVSIAGILKADCVYVPLDNESPANRLAKIVEKCQPSAILVSGPVGKRLTNLLEQANLDSNSFVGWLDPEGIQHKKAINGKMKAGFTHDDLTSASSQSRDYKNSSSDAAHILFTSGTNGDPKGVVTSHRNDLEFIRWAKNYFGIQADDRLSNHSPFHFDMSSLDIYGALSTGAQLHLVPRDYNAVPNKIANFIRESGITQWFSVPSILNYMANFDVVDEDDFSSLKRLIWGGEVFPVSTLKYWMERLPDVSFTNLYGPTETTIASCYYTVPEIPGDGNSEIPIGMACPGEDMYLLDDHLNPVSEGEIGELYISGVGVSKGYWNDKERTDQVFKFNPYAIQGDRIFYKTGDLAHLGEDGYFYFNGRKDNQIKNKGHRIEPGEIERAVDSLQLTMECAVVAIPGEGLNNNKICCAYVPSGRQKSHIAGAYLKLKLCNLLPDHMIPDLWESYVILPKNKNGKINRDKLEKHFLSVETEPCKEY